ncbi:MAG: mechanosensitive ion channel, partial [Rhodobacteraceae bacterium]
MEYLDQLMSFEIASGKTVGDLLTIDFLLGVAGQVVLAAIILIVGFFVAGFVKRRIMRLTDRSRHFDKTMGSFLANVARYGILALTIIFVLQQFGFQTTSLVALLGAAGLAIGLALQGVLGGVAAGVMLVVFRPIKVGDFVDVNGVAGTVKDISIFTTELASLDNVQIIIPNSEVWGNVIK